jgi:hypothetical protein
MGLLDALARIAFPFEVGGSPKAIARREEGSLNDQFGRSD